jgi:hypothetical protein
MSTDPNWALAASPWNADENLAVGGQFDWDPEDDIT